MRRFLITGAVILSASAAQGQGDVDMSASAAVEALSAAVDEQARVGALFADVPLETLLGPSGAGRSTLTPHMLTDFSETRRILSEHLEVMQSGLEIEGDTEEVRVDIEEAHRLLALYDARSAEFLEAIRTSPFSDALIEELAAAAANDPEDAGLVALAAAAAEGAARSAAEPEWRLAYGELGDVPLGGLATALEMVRAQEARCLWLVGEVDRRAPACLLAARGNAHLLVQTLQRREPGGERDRILEEARAARARLDEVRGQL